ncbi:hypothetical protein DESC_140005 [Desulfosarcina cetonica]|nr:hypothetical protein DESC_140005 [Desulfosarcina cetonica]
MRANDFALETIPDQFRQSADVIDVSMGEKQVIDLGGFDRPALHGRFRIVALGHAAIHHDVQAICLEQVAGTGDTVFGAEMGDVHWLIDGNFFVYHVTL